MTKDKVDRTIEEAVIEFQQKEIKPNMTPEKILALYKKMTTDHAILEAKILVMRATFFTVLQSELAKEQEAAERENPLSKALNYLT